MKKLFTLLKIFAVLFVLIFQMSTVWGQIFEENFDYPIGSLLTANGWTAHSGAGNQPPTVSDGLFFDGYAGSNIGGAALLDNNGEDVHRTFPSQVAGVVYTAFIIQTESSNSPGYFLHLGQSTIGTTFFTRVWVNATGDGLGLSGSSAPASYVPMTAGVPTLVVTKFDIASKVSSLFVFNSFPESEPLTADFTFTENSSYSVGSVALRQYNASERVIVDGIRIANNWDDAVTASGGPPSVAAPTFSPPGGIYYSSQNISISTTTPDATIYYTTDGTDPDENSNLYTIPVPINITTVLKARAYAEGLDPSSIAVAFYTFPIEVANIATLKNSALSGLYHLTGEAVLTFSQTFRNQKYIQDATAGILIDDLSGVITTSYNVGDGITGIYGTLNVFGNMFQFTPSQDPGPATSTGNAIVPQVVTIGGLFSNFAAYESRVIKIVNASFADAGATFANGIVYEISDASEATGDFRTTFYDVNYIGTQIPGGNGNIVGIPNARSEGYFITSRSLDDLEFIPTGPITVNTIAQLRAGQLGQEYILSGEAVLTYQQAWRNQKFVQDATAAILIDDFTGIITTAYSPGDGITGLSGILVNHNGMLRLAVNADPGAPTSVNNVIVPEVITIAQLNANFMNYQSELIKIEDVTFANGGATFAYGTNYPISDNTDAAATFRTEFLDANYLGNTIPSVPTDLVVIPNTVSNANYVTSRYASDIQPSVLFPTITVVSPNGYEYWEQGSTQNITWTSQDFSGNVKITLVRPPLYTLVLATSIPNSGFFEWQVPAAQQVGNNYKIRIQGVNGGDPMDESDNFFNIVAELPVPKIVINEIMYNPSNSNPFLSDSYYEYLELFNNGNFDVDLTGWTISTAIVHTFAEGTILLQGQYLVLAVNADSVGTFYGISNVVKWNSGALNNTGETIELKASDGTLMDVVAYSSSSPWPLGANGLGSSLELIDPDLDNNLPENWIASPQNFGTPGIQNSAFGFQGLTVTAPNGGETFIQGETTDVTWTRVNFNGLLKIELITATREDVVLAENIPAINGTWPWEIAADQTVGTNYKIRVSDMEDGQPVDESDGVFSIVSVIVPELTLLTPNGGENIQQGTTYNITWSSANYEGTILIELMTAEKAGSAITLGTVTSTFGTFAWEVTQDAGDNYLIKISDELTGIPADESDAVFSIILPPPTPNVVISEIMYNSPEGGTDTLEYLELYNADNIAHNLAGWYFSAGIDMILPDYELLPGAYLVVAYNANAVFNAFSVAALQWTSGGLSNGGEAIELKNAANVVIDFVLFDDASPWPIAPDGFGPSLSLIDLASDNELAENWAPETAFALINADGIPVYGTPGAPNFPTPAQSFLIPAGWGGISTYIVPDQPNVADVMERIVDDLTIMQNFNQIYFPFYNINTIGNWNNNVGYQLRTEALRYHVIHGTLVTNKTVNLNTGWNMLPVLSECEVGVAALLGGIPEIIYVQELGTNLVYWPDGGLYTLVNFVPGKAYFIKVSGAIPIVFPECSK
ncbi:MAG: lamin tail domain-containing protein [Bacteroidales bacterium]|nr:lamin tail domain-containing protein [Bacteroidales bacterium]